MALTYSWTLITTGQTDADSPLNQSLMDAIREDLLHNHEWLGKDYTPAENHDHDGTNSKLITAFGDDIVTQAMMKNSANGTTKIIQHATERSTSSSSYVKLKEIAINRAGSYRVVWEYKTDGSGTVYAKVYKNGGAIGTEKSTTSGTYISVGDDLGGFTVGDAIQIYVKKSSGTGYVRNMELQSSVQLEMYSHPDY